MIYFFVEHTSKGILMELATESDDGKSHWSWSKPRSDARKFPFLEQAIAASKLNEKSYVVEYDPSRKAGYRFRVVWPERRAA